MSTRKRRHHEAFKESSKPPSLTEEEKEKLRSEKEEEIWATVREAHFEAIESLPLALERQSKLLRQIDGLTHATMAQILPALHDYIDLRRQIEKKSPPPQAEIPEVVELEKPLEGTEPSVEPVESSEHTSEPLVEPVEPSSSRVPSQDVEPPPASRTPTPSTSHPPNVGPGSSRQAVRKVAMLAEFLLQKSQEKVNIAQTNCDSIDRHIHLLDQAIEEQEAALSADPSKPIHFHLPELVLPQSNRTNKDQIFEDELDMELEEQATPTTVEEPPPTTTKKGKRTSKKKGKDGAGKAQANGNDTTSLTITLPAVQSNEEPAYCYCQRVSFGEMIACDNQDCEREWFHLGCVGLTEPPDGEWYCEDCNSEADET